MTVDLPTKLAFLRSQGALDHVVECIETHMAWVFLSEHRAWKLKKPVRLPYLDHSTIERRRHSCLQELRLGRRLAANVYLDVVPLVAGPRGLAIDRTAGPGPAGNAVGVPTPRDSASLMDGTGEIVDWLVVMRRLPAERMLPRMITQGVATPVEADAIGDLLVAFYRDAVRAPWNGAEYRQRLRNTIVADGGELVERGASRSQIGAIVDMQLAGIEHEARLLDQRIADGRVVDAHGDLRPEHVCLESPPVVIDPLEFDDELRMLDAVSELAFFALECERLRATWFGNRVLARYIEGSGDPAPPAVIALYRTQHALTRALIALRHIDDVEPAEQPRWRAKADEYLSSTIRAEHA